MSFSYNMEGYQPTDYSDMISQNYQRNHNGYMIDYQEPNYQYYYDISSIQRPLEMPMTQRPGFGRLIIPQQYRMAMRLPYFQMPMMQQAPLEGSISQQRIPKPL
ncbi:MAG: hypothetical protein MHMPM18_003153 [Marteilia pararefringens]